MNILFMLIDDDPVVNFVSKLMVTKHGLTDDPRIFENGKPALDFLTSHYQEYDKIILLLDINMPEMSGWDVLDQLSQARPDLCKRVNVFMLSSSISDKDIARSMEYEVVQDYLTKPISAEKCERIASATIGKY